jgi:hypothetical protein
MLGQGVIQGVSTIITIITSINTSTAQGIPEIDTL